MSKKPVLVHITNGFDIGGIQLSCATILPLLAEKYEVHWIAYKQQGVLFDEMPKLGVTTHFAPSSGRFSPRTLYRYYKKFKELKADIVHSHSHSPNIFAPIAASLAGVPVKIGHIRTMMHWYGSTKFRRARQRFEEDLVFSIFGDKMITISKETLQLAKENMPRCADKIILSHNGSRMPELRKLSDDEKLSFRKKHGIENDELIFGFVGRIEAYKGVGFLLDAAKNWYENGVKFKLAFLGKTSKNTRHWEEKSLSIGDGKRVLWLGANKNAHDFYPHFDVFMFASHHRAEGFPNVLVEAGFNNLPILSSKMNPAQEFNEYYNRMLFFDDFDDETQALEAILKLPVDTSNRIEHFTCHAMVNRLDKIYQSVLKEKK